MQNAGKRYSMADSRHVPCRDGADAQQASAAVAAQRRSAPGFVQSLSRALSILEALAEEDRDGVRLIDVSRRLDLAPSTAHRLLTTMEQHRFVQFDPERSVWRVGATALSVGAAFLRRRSLLDQALPYLRRLCDAAGETVNLGTHEGGEVLFLGQVTSLRPARRATRPGGRAPMHCSGLGKAMLAGFTLAQVSGVLQDRGLTRLTPRTIALPRELGAELDRVRRRGFAFDDEENALGLRCVAATIWDECRRPLGAISLAAPAAKLGDERVERLGTLVAGVAGEITSALGGRAPLRSS